MTIQSLERNLFVLIPPAVIFITSLQAFAIVLFPGSRRKKYNRILIAAPIFLLAMAYTWFIRYHLTGYSGTFHDVNTMVLFIFTTISIFFYLLVNKVHKGLFFPGMALVILYVLMHLAYIVVMVTLRPSPTDDLIQLINR